MSSSRISRPRYLSSTIVPQYESAFLGTQGGRDDFFDSYFSWLTRSHIKICSHTSLLCGLNKLASRYVVLFGLNCATRHATMQPNMQPHAGGARNPSGHIFPIPCHSEPDSLPSNETPGAPQLNSLTVPRLMDGRCSHHQGWQKLPSPGLLRVDQSPFAPIPNTPDSGLR